MELDLGAVRAFVAVADDGLFGAAADQLGLTQQAVSKRIAKLEAGLRTTLVHRSSQGTGLTENGAAFLPQARALVTLADQAVETVRGRCRPLRVDVLNTRIVLVDLIRAFHEAHDDVEIDIVTSNALRSGRSALADGTVDVGFGRRTDMLDAGIEYLPAYLDPLHVLVGREHPFARRRRVRAAELAGTVARMPANRPGTDWADFYDELARAFSLTIDTSGPHFGTDQLLDEIAGSPNRLTFGGHGVWLAKHRGIVQVPVVDPVPVYPHFMLWQRSNRHPALPRLAQHIRDGFEPFDPARQWLPPADARVVSV